MSAISPSQATEFRYFSVKKTLTSSQVQAKNFELEPDAKIGYRHLIQFFTICKDKQPLKVYSLFVKLFNCLDFILHNLLSFYIPFGCD